MLGAFVFALSVDGLGAGYHYLLDREALIDDDLVEKGGADIIHLGELAEIRQVVLVGRQVEDDLYV